MDRTPVAERLHRRDRPPAPARPGPAGRGRSPGRRSPAEHWLAVTRALSWHRRLVAAALAAVAVLAALDVLRPAPVLGVPVVVASRDLPAGARLDATELTVVLERPGTAPSGSARSPAELTGALLAAPLRAGEPITDVRLVSAALLAAYAPSLGRDVGEATVRLSDPGGVATVTAGSLVDVLAATTAGPRAGAPASVIAAGVPVLAVPGRAAGPTSTGGGLLSAAASQPVDSAGGLLVLAVTPATARLLAQAAVTSQLSVLVHPR